MEYLIVCPLVFLAGLMDSIAGGGGLISLPAYLIAGLPAHVAIGTNKLGSAMGTSVSTGRFLKNGYLKEKGMLKLALSAAFAALIGSSIGARLSLLISEAIIKNMMLIVLPIVAFYVLKKKNIGNDENTDILPYGKMLFITMISAFLIGGYDGFYGPGTGTFLILILTGAARMNIRKASAMTKVINLTSNISALVTFMIHGQVLYPLGLCAGIFCIAGHYIGSGMVVENGQKIVRPVILIVLMILALKIILW